MRSQNTCECKEKCMDLLREVWWEQFIRQRLFLQSCGERSRNINGRELHRYKENGFDRARRFEIKQQIILFIFVLLNIGCEKQLRKWVQRLPPWYDRLHYLVFASPAYRKSLTSLWHFYDKCRFPPMQLALDQIIRKYLWSSIRRCQEGAFFGSYQILVMPFEIRRR